MFSVFPASSISRKQTFFPSYPDAVPVGEKLKTVKNDEIYIKKVWGFLVFSMARLYFR